jgi:hypothetical protein
MEFDFAFQKVRVLLATNFDGLFDRNHAVQVGAGNGVLIVDIHRDLLMVGAHVYINHLMIVECCQSKKSFCRATNVKVAPNHHCSGFSMNESFLAFLQIISL